jgi:hypothetical protein
LQNIGAVWFDAVPNAATDEVGAFLEADQAAAAAGRACAGTRGGGRGAQLAISVAVWVGLPPAVGLWRTARRDVA